MGTLSSVDVINQYYDLRLDIFNSSYATLCTEQLNVLWIMMTFHHSITNFTLRT